MIDNDNNEIKSVHLATVLRKSGKENYKYLRTANKETTDPTFSFYAWLIIIITTVGVLAYALRD